MSSNMMVDALDVATALGEYKALHNLMLEVSDKANEALKRYEQLKQELVNQYDN